MRSIIIVAILFWWCPIIPIVVILLEMNRQRKISEARQDLIDRLDRQNYLHTEYGEAVLADFDKYKGQTPPPIPKRPLPPNNHWHNYTLPDGVKPWTGFTNRQVYDRGILIDPPREATPEERRIWWDSPCKIDLTGLNL